MRFYFSDIYSMFLYFQMTQALRSHLMLRCKMYVHSTLFRFCYTDNLNA